MLLIFIYGSLFDDFHSLQDVELPVKCFLSSLPVLLIFHWYFLLKFTDIYKNHSKFDLFIYLSRLLDHTVQQCPYDDISFVDSFSFHVLL
jgi:hypothetical protein